MLHISVYFLIKRYHKLVGHVCVYVCVCVGKWLSLLDVRDNGLNVLLVVVMTERVHIMITVDVDGEVLYFGRPTICAVPFVVLPSPFTSASVFFTICYSTTSRANNASANIWPKCRWLHMCAWHNKLPRGCVCECLRDHCLLSTSQRLGLCAR